MSLQPTPKFKLGDMVFFWDKSKWCKTTCTRCPTCQTPRDVKTAECYTHRYYGPFKVKQITIKYNRYENNNMEILYLVDTLSGNDLDTLEETNIFRTVEEARDTISTFVSNTPGFQHDINDLTTKEQKCV